MAMFGEDRDFSLIVLINRELMGNIIEQKIGYYKIVLSESPSNIYGETINKKYANPVLINCLLLRGDMAESSSDLGSDVTKELNVRLLRQDLVDANLIPETGDIVMFNENYYEVDLKNENQLFLGKDQNYSYSTDTDGFGGSLSIILTCHYMRAEIPGIKLQTL